MQEDIVILWKQNNTAENVEHFGESLVNKQLNLQLSIKLRLTKSKEFQIKLENLQSIVWSVFLWHYFMWAWWVFFFFVLNELCFLWGQTNFQYTCFIFVWVIYASTHQKVLTWACCILLCFVLSFLYHTASVHFSLSLTTILVLLSVLPLSLPFFYSTCIIQVIILRYGLCDWCYIYTFALC